MCGEELRESKKAKRNWTRQETTAKVPYNMEAEDDFKNGENVCSIWIIYCWHNKSVPSFIHPTQSFPDENVNEFYFTQNAQYNTFNFLLTKKIG